MKTGIELISEERKYQIEKHGFTGEHHANHPEWYEHGQLLHASHMIAAYGEEDSITNSYKQFCPLNWDIEWWQRMCDKPLKERLIIAGALIAAEIDRVNHIEKVNL